MICLLVLVGLGNIVIDYRYFAVGEIKTITDANLSAVPGLFTINEPVIFGLPLILNPIMAIPFILTPLVQVLVAYLAIWSGIVPRLSGKFPLAPIFLNGFLAGGWQVAVLQVVCVLAGCLLYIPFVKVLDKGKLKQKQKLRKRSPTN